MPTSWWRRDPTGCSGSWTSVPTPRGSSSDACTSRSARPGAGIGTHPATRGSEGRLPGQADTLSSHRACEERGRVAVLGASRVRGLGRGGHPGALRSTSRPRVRRGRRSPSRRCSCGGRPTPRSTRSPSAPCQRPRRRSSPSDNLGRVPAVVAGPPRRGLRVRRGGGANQTGHNIMLYRDDVPNVEVGVQVSGPFDERPGAPSELPAGRVATTVHRGPYGGLEEAHAAVRAWCAVTATRSPACAGRSTATGTRIPRSSRPRSATSCPNRRAGSEHRSPVVLHADDRPPLRPCARSSARSAPAAYAKLTIRVVVEDEEPQRRPVARGG